MQRGSLTAMAMDPGLVGWLARPLLSWHNYWPMRMATLGGTINLVQPFFKSKTCLAPWQIAISTALPVAATRTSLAPGTFE